MNRQIAVPAKLRCREKGFERRHVRSKLACLALVIAIVAMNACLARCQVSDLSDQQQIQALIQKLVTHVAAGELLDPSLPAVEREEQTRPFAISYEIKLDSEGPVQVSGTTARVPVRLTFENSSATSHEELEKSASLTFVKQNNQWYFANYDFLKASPVEIVIFGWGMLFAATWTFLVLRKWRALRKKRTGPFELSGAISDYFHSLNPFSWFREN